jgi:hypothetical protein
MANTTNFGWETPDDTDLVKDGAAAIRTLGSAIDTSLVDLKGGTTGQVLSKTSNTDMDFTWVAQDDSNAIQNAIVDAKGDLISATAADTPARLAVGANGTVLTADSAETTGLKWATPNAGANWTLLNTGGTALTGAQTITISGISGKDKILVLFAGASSVNASDYIGLRLNTDSGTNYTQRGGTVQGASTWAAGNVGTFDQSGATFIYVGEMSNNAGSFLQGYVELSGCNSSGVKAFTLSGGCFANGGSGHRFITGGGIYDSSSVITSVSAFSNSSNFDAGSIYVYTSA